MTSTAQRHEDIYQQLVAELTEREGRYRNTPLPDAANDALFHPAGRSRRGVGALVLLAALAAIIVGSSPLAVGGALALMAVLATPLIAIERGNAGLLMVTIAGGAVGTAAAYALSPPGAAAAVAGIAAGLVLLSLATGRD